jgi:hypothetical protein
MVDVLDNCSTAVSVTMTGMVDVVVVLIVLVVIARSGSTVIVCVVLIVTVNLTVCVGSVMVVLDDTMLLSVKVVIISIPASHDTVCGWTTGEASKPLVPIHILGPLARASKTYFGVGGLGVPLFNRRASAVMILVFDANGVKPAAVVMVMVGVFVVVENTVCLLVDVAVEVVL